MAEVFLHINADNIEKIQSQLDNIEKTVARIEKSGKTGFSFSNASRGLSSIEDSAYRVERAFRQAGNAVASIGRGLQGVGNMFGGKVVGTVKTMATAFGTMGLYSAAQGTVQRYDTMKIFPKMMQHLGYSAKDATAAVTKLEDAVIGLPTGLDEIVESARQLIPLTGDLNKGVNLAIAANNAFLAGGSDAQSQRYGQRQIKDLLAKGTLRSQEWDSLFTALGSGLGVIAEEMGYSGKARKGNLSTINDDLKYAESRLKSLRNTQKRLQTEGGTAKQISKNQQALAAWQKEYDKLTKKQDKSLGSFRNALKTNQISALDFLDALEKVGTGEGELAKRADDYKETISAAARNIKNALQKMGAAGLDALDNVLVERTGKGIPATIREISDSIKQNLIPSLEDWISDNGDGIVSFFDRLKNYNWGDLVGKIGKGLATYYDILSKFFTSFSPSFVGALAVWAGPVGKAITAVGNSVRAFGGIAATIMRIFGKGKAKAFDEAVEGASKMGKIGFSFQNAFKGLALSAGIIGEIALIGGVIFEYAKVLEKISNMNFGSNLGKNMAEVGKLLAVTGSITVIATSILGFLQTMPGFEEAALVGGGLFSGFLLLVSLIGEVIKQYVEIVGEVGKMTLPSESKVSNLGKLVKSIHDDVLDEVPTIPNSKVKSLERLTESVDYVGDIAQKLKDIASFGSVGNISTRIKNILDSADVIIKRKYTREDKTDAKKAKNVLKPLSEATGSVEKIAQALAKMKNNVKSLIKRGDATELQNLSSGITNMMAQVDKIVKPFNESPEEYSDAQKNLKSVEKSITSISTVVTTLFSVRKKIKGIVTEGKDGKYYSKTADRVGGLVGSLIMSFDEAHLGFDTKELQRQMDNIGRVAEAITGVSTIVTTLSSVSKKLKKLVPRAYKDPTSLFGDAVSHLKSGKKMGRSPVSIMGERIVTLVKELNEVSKQITDADVDTSGDAAEAVQSLASNIEKLPAIVELLGNVKKPLKDLGIPKEDGEKWTLGTRLKTLVGGLTEAFKGTAGEDFSQLGKNAENVYTAVKNIKWMANQLAAVQKVVNDNFTFEGDTWDLGKKLGMIMEGLTGVFNQGNILTGDGQKTAGTMGSIAPMLQAVAEQLGVLAANAKAAKGSLPGVKSGIKGIGEAAKQYNGSLNELASNLSKIKQNVGFGGKAILASAGITILGTAAKNQVENLSSAASAAADLASAIESIPSNKTVNVTATGNGVSSGGTKKPPKQKRWIHAKGGMIYGPGGIDNVPAWLTAGEFVMRKSAVNKFGAGFMSHINNMDIDGAIRALSIRAGAGVFQKGGMVTNNYSRDNHANVTFNIGRASQGYSQRRANRWARALS